MNDMKIEAIDTSSFADHDHHERVVRCVDPSSGLSAVVAIHNRNLGPALGGCRMRAYENPEAAVADVLKLSRGMTYKSAMAELPLGGGKAVIDGPPSNRTEALMEAMGTFVDALGGDYIIAEDSGTSVADMVVIARNTRHVAGIKDKQLTDGSVVDGDPSRSTAYGVFRGIEASAAFRLNVASLDGVQIAIQGVGHVGYHLAHLLADAGARLVIADVNPERIAAIRQEIDVRVVDVDEIHRTPSDIFVPCALGGVVSFDALGEMPAQIIAGAANNQIASDAAGYELFARGKLYAPDYVINAGGIIDIFYEREGYDHKRVVAHIDRIGNTLREIFAASRERQEPTHVIADRIARQRFNAEKPTRRVDVA